MKTIREVSMQYGISRFTLSQAAKNGRLGEAAVLYGTSWAIDDEHPDFQRWLEAHSKHHRAGSRIEVILKAQGPGPAYAYIRRIGESMSDQRDPRNHMLLSDEQERAYEKAYMYLKQGDVDSAHKALKAAHFNWIRVERPDGD